MKPKIKYDEEELGILEAWETGCVIQSTWTANPELLGQ